MDPTPGSGWSPDVSRGTLQERADELARKVYLGGPADRFEQDGRLILIALIRRGLDFDAPVIDVGCGALRAGYWLIHFLQPGMYHGIEPSRRRLDAAREALLEPGVEELKRPRFSHNADWDLGVFGVAPRFVVARSIWSHAPKPAVSALLDSFARVAAPDGLLLASYVPVDGDGPAPASGPARLLRSVGRRIRALTGRGPGAVARDRRTRGGRRSTPRARRTDHTGDEWGDPEHGQLVAHRFAWIQDACERRGLVATRSAQDRFGGQVWLEIRRERP
jgi:SAM-dependent methyltransferase